MRLKKNSRESSSFLHHPSCFECLMQTKLVHGFDAAGGDHDADVLFEFRNVDAALLEVGVAASFAGRVKLRGASTVAVTAANL